MRFEFTIERPRAGVMNWKLKANGRCCSGTVEKPKARVHTMMLSCIREAADALEKPTKSRACGPHVVMWFYDWLSQTNFSWVFQLDAHRLDGSAPKIGESRAAVERFKF